MQPTNTKSSFLTKLNPPTFPVLVTEKNKNIVALFGSILAVLIYAIPNHFPIFEPRLLPLSNFELSIPLVPWTVWIYSTEMILIALPFFATKDAESSNRYLFAFFALQTLSCVFFVFFPTTYPRDLYPLDPQTMDSLTFALFSHVRVADAPTNCLPSLHVSSVYLASMAFYQESRKIFRWCFIWATAIALSTLTTKQHYIVDIISGLLMAMGSYWLFYYKVQFKRFN